MSEANVQINNDSRPNPKHYWYAGTDQLEVGYAMCIDVAATKGILKTSLGRQVTKPATANLMHFAGVVMSACKGPCQVKLAIPDRNYMGEVFTKANMVKDVTVLGPVDALYSLAIKLDDHNATPATTTGHNLPSVALALETVDTSSTAANKLVRFL
ncbi:hypothetical protein LCGC14_1652840 [marine sediment metagenome]|uniref:Uncharacterized protein n=1 Tax=marine sediment metagenome TaxID=412755 RepID=A0A0F9IIV3_9ZZZZ